MERGGLERTVASVPVACHCTPFWDAAQSCGGPGAPSCHSCNASRPCHALQIEALMMEMQNPDTGIKTQSQRVMITNIPHAVAGKSFAGERDWAKEVHQRKAVCGPHGHPRVTTAWVHTGARVLKNICRTSFETNLLLLSHSHSCLISLLAL